MDSFTRGSMVFDVRDAGPASGEPVVLLHGFPESSAAWGLVTPALNAQGLRTLAPDLRGYSPGARPRGRRRYRVESMVGDVLALLDAAGLPDAHLVGHDWGGFLAWQVAGTHPDRVRTLTVLSTPHPAAMQWAMRHSTQALKSTYMAFFNIPRVPEYLMSKGISRNGLRSLELDPQFEREYVEKLLEPGALEAALNWYRAIPTRPAQQPPVDRLRITVPTTYLWGNQDRYLGRAAAERTGQYCDGDYEFIEADADHWIPEKNPDLTATTVLRRIAHAS